jgi:glycosyltransferase involved in cell wall biosynthesis
MSFTAPPAQIDRVVVISDDCVVSGGAAAMALASIRLLRERGVAVTLLTGDHGDNPDLAATGVEIVSLGGIHLLDGNRAAAAARGLYCTTTRARLQDWIRTHDTPGTVYHLHNWHKILSPSVFVPLRNVAARLFMTAHDFFLACPNGGYFNYRTSTLCDLTPMSAGCLATACDKRHHAHKLWRAARHAVRSAALPLAATSATVLAVHEGMRPFLQRGGIADAQIAVLRNPVTPWCTERVTAERNRGILYAGRLELDKGADVVARAARAAGVPLMMAGSGPLDTMLRQTHPEVELHGQFSKQLLSKLARSARVVVVPTRWRETFGLVALEALMSGIPVIVSHAALIGKEVEALGCALICNPSDETALAAQLQLIARDDALVARMSARAFANARALAPTSAQWCDQLLDLYQRKLSALRTERGPSMNPAPMAKADARPMEIAGTRMVSGG